MKIRKQKIEMMISQCNIICSSSPIPTTRALPFNILIPIEQKRTIRYTHVLKKKRLPQ